MRRALPAFHGETYLFLPLGFPIARFDLIAVEADLALDRIAAERSGIFHREFIAVELADDLEVDRVVFDGPFFDRRFGVAPANISAGQLLAVLLQFERRFDRVVVKG